MPKVENPPTNHKYTEYYKSFGRGGFSFQEMYRRKYFPCVFCLLLNYFFRFCQAGLSHLYKM